MTPGHQPVTHVVRTRIQDRVPETQFQLPRCLAVSRLGPWALGLGSLCPILACIIHSLKLASVTFQSANHLFSNTLQAHPIPPRQRFAPQNVAPLAWACSPLAPPFPPPAPCSLCSGATDLCSFPPATKLALALESGILLFPLPEVFSGPFH